jgi:hypothetical protein
MDRRVATSAAEDGTVKQREKGTIFCLCPTLATLAQSLETTGPVNVPCEAEQIKGMLGSRCEKKQVSKEHILT